MGNGCVGLITGASVGGAAVGEAGSGVGGSVGKLVVVGSRVFVGISMFVAVGSGVDEAAIVSSLTGVLVANKTGRGVLVASN